MARPVTLIAGDGIGPEVTDAARAVVDATGVKIAWVEREAGRARSRAPATRFPTTAAEHPRDQGRAEGPITTPVGRVSRA
jgi:isocitrate dehydrogenase (NAD+)